MADALGQLRHHFAIEAVTIVRDEGGGAVASSAEIARAWGSLRGGGGGLPFLADAFRARTTHTITIRAHIGLTTAHQLRLGPRVFIILAITDRDGTGRFLDCACEERT